MKKCNNCISSIPTATKDSQGIIQLECTNKLSPMCRFFVNEKNACEQYSEIKDGLPGSVQETTEDTKEKKDRRS